MRFGTVLIRFLRGGPEAAGARRRVLRADPQACSKPEKRAGQ